MNKILKNLLPLLIIFSFSCATETVTEEVDPEPRETNFTLTSPENGQLFSIAINRVPFTFSYTRESTDFSEYAFTLDLCRDEALTTDCINPVLVSDISSVSSNEDEDESGAFLPTVTKLQPISPLRLLGLFILSSILCYALFLRGEKRSQLAPVGTLTLFAFLILGGVLGGVLSCTETLTEQVTRDSSPELTGTAAIPIEISAEALGAYYYRITATRADDDTAEPETQSGQFFYGWEEPAELNLTAVTLNDGDNVGAPILVEGATSYSLSGCDDFTINATTGQVAVASFPPTSASPQNCTLTIAGGANPLVLGLTIDYEDIVFGMESYSFSLFNNAPMDEDVGDPVTATSLDRTAVTYSLDSCTGFTIDGTSGQISTAADNPTPGTINCTVTATTAGDTNSIEVEIIVNTDVLTFGMAPYSFSLFSNAVMDENVGDPVTATSLDGGAVSYTLGTCTGFQIDGTSGQISTTADNPAIGTSNCMVTARRTAVTTAQIAVEIVVNNAISFDEESYTLVVLETAEANDDVGDAVTATFAGGGTVTYALASCTGFTINSTSGQISVMTADPTAGVRNCMVTATSGTFTATIPVTINVSVLCTATGLPENGAENTITLGPQDGDGDNCGAWEITVNHPADASTLVRQVRVYRLENLIVGTEYTLTGELTPGPAFPAISSNLISYGSAPILDSQLTGIEGRQLEIFNPPEPRSSSSFTSSETQYHINFVQVTLDSVTVITVTPR